MTFVQLLPVILSLLVLGAHFLRSGSLAALLAVLGLLGCLAVRRAWVPRLVIVALAIGTLEWTRTLIALAGDRLRSGQPYARLVVILAGVALLTALSSLVFLSARLRARYGGGASPP